MAADTKIEWATHTFNPWRGCAHAPLSDGSEHPGCAHCYAETMSKRNPATLGRWGENGTRVVAAEKQWQAVERWNERAPSEGLMDRVFCASLADVFEDWQGRLIDRRGNEWFVCRNCLHRETFPASTAQANPEGQPCLCDDPQLGCWMTPLTMADVRQRLFGLIDRTPNLMWLLLTKRPGNVLYRWPGNMIDQLPVMLRHRTNVALLTSISDQATADELIPQLLRLRDLVPVLGLSVEPLLAPVDLPLDGISWVIVGGESGPHARPCSIEWIRSIVEQCREADVRCFVKQLGSKPVQFDDGGITGNERYDVPYWTNDKKGGDPDEWPEDLRVREFPAAFYRQEVQA